MTAQRRLQNLRKIDYITPFLAGVGIGVAVSVLLAPEAGGKTRSRIRDIASGAGDALKERAEDLGDATADAFEEGKLAWRAEQNERSQIMSDLKDKAKEKIDDAADAAKKAAAKVVDKSKDVAHSAGKKMEEGGNRLQDA
jgi:gas vesicle protein